MKEYSVAFEVYGVRVGITSNRKSMIELIRSRLPLVIPVPMKSIKGETAERHFAFIKQDDLKFRIETDNEETTFGWDLKSSLDNFLGCVRIKIAEYAVGKVFIHSGAVGWKGSGIIFPANSFQGKSTLTAALVKQGCEYYSDEYAVLDENSMLHPYPKTLSIRGIEGEFVQTEIAASEFGETAHGPVPVKMVLFTSYERDSRLDLIPVSKGAGMIEILRHTLPIRYNPRFCIKVLNNVMNGAIISKSSRGDADQTAEQLILHFDELLKNSTRE